MPQHVQQIFTVMSGILVHQQDHSPVVPENNCYVQQLSPNSFRVPTFSFRISDLLLLPMIQFLIDHKSLENTVLFVLPQRQEAKLGTLLTSCNSTYYPQDWNLRLKNNLEMTRRPLGT